jgi:hypothetical protein
LLIGWLADCLMVGCCLRVCLLVCLFVDWLFGALFARFFVRLTDLFD